MSLLLSQSSPLIQVYSPEKNELLQCVSRYLYPLLTLLSPSKAPVARTL